MGENNTSSQLNQPNEEHLCPFHPALSQNQVHILHQSPDPLMIPDTKCPMHNALSPPPESNHNHQNSHVVEPHPVPTQSGQTSKRNDVEHLCPYHLGLKITHMNITTQDQDAIMRPEGHCPFHNNNSESSDTISFKKNPNSQAAPASQPTQELVRQFHNSAPSPHRPQQIPVSQPSQSPPRTHEDQQFQHHQSQTTKSNISHMPSNNNSAQQPWTPESQRTTLQSPQRPFPHESYNAPQQPAQESHKIPPSTQRPPSQDGYNTPQPTHWPHTHANFGNHQNVPHPNYQHESQQMPLPPQSQRPTTPHNGNQRSPPPRHSTSYNQHYPQHPFSAHTRQSDSNNPQCQYTSHAAGSSNNAQTQYESYQRPPFALTRAFNPDQPPIYRGNIFYNRSLIISQLNPNHNINRMDLSLGGSDLMISTTGEDALIALPVTQTLEALQRLLFERDWNNNSTNGTSTNEN